MFGAKLLAWYWPYNHAAMANEALLLGLAFGLGLTIWRGWPRVGLDRGAALGLVFYATASFAGLGLIGEDGMGFGHYRYYLFSTETCEFTARLPKPPDRASAQTASYADLATASAWMAECVDLAAEPPPSMLEAMLGESLLSWARSSGLADPKLQSESTDGVTLVKLSGLAGGSILPERASEPSLTRIESWAYGGRRSVLRLTVSQPGADGPSASARAFLASAKHRAGGGAP